jgi:hypothetical protein
VASSDCWKAVADLLSRGFAAVAFTPAEEDLVLVRTSVARLRFDPASTLFFCRLEWLIVRHNFGTD